MSEDFGFFGPDSVSWRVHRETFVLFGGARALLLQAAHPLIMAGATATGFYERDPWKRLMRTLQFAYSITFGSKSEALAAATHINQVHERVNGIDPVTGLQYDALDPELLLWVHAVLVDSALVFEKLLVGKLDDDDRQQFHEEQMIAAEMLRLPRDLIPPTYEKLRGYIDSVIKSDILQTSPGSESVAALIQSPPPEAEWKPILKVVSFWAFGTLPARVREIYGMRWDPIREATLRASMLWAKLNRPLIPASFREIEIARKADAKNGLSPD